MSPPAFASVSLQAPAASKADAEPQQQLQAQTTTSAAADPDVAQVLFTAEQLHAKTQELGRVLAAEYKDKQPLLAPILKGGFVFAADLVRAMTPCPAGLGVEFISARSYGARTETSGEVEVSFDESAVAGRHCLLVDDLCDSGLTLKTVHEKVLAAGAASVKSVVALDKRGRRKVEYHPDFVGADVGNVWLAGYGMDTHQQYRAFGDVVVLTQAAIDRALGRA